ncbi:MAG: hypothetical protein KA053_01965 [Lentimicrobiaceae bacterium]|nr:hypothetical protein [Lentimicrobiaceae bacterium]
MDYRDQYIYQLVVQLPDMVPGILKAHVYRMPAHGESLITHLAMTFHPENEIQWEKEDGMNFDFSPFLNPDRLYDWIDESETPFGKEKQQTASLDLFSSLNNSILFLRITNAEIDHQLLLFLSFPGNQLPGTFALLRGGIHKQALMVGGQILRYSLQLIYTAYLEAHITQQGFLKQTRQAIGHLDHARRLLQSERENLMDTRVEWCRHALQSLSDKHQIRFTFSQELNEKIRNYRGTVPELIWLLTQGANYLITLYADMKPDEIQIPAWCMDAFPFTQQDNKETATPIKGVSGGLSRTMELLDKLELASRKVLDNNLKLTSAHVGAHCPVPISAPAISDSIRTHKTRIIKLMHQHPQKWPILREKFRPILRIMEEEVNPVAQRAG